MADWIFDAPAGVTDFRDPNNWHSVMQGEAAGIIRELVASVLQKDAGKVTPAEIAQHAPSLAYVDPVSTPPTDPGQTVAIAPWGAFPRAVQRRAPWTDFAPNAYDPDGSFRASEQLGDEDHRPGIFVDPYDRVLHLPVRHRQDEYLEWVGRKNSKGKLAKAIFVAEGYDYYSALFEHDEGRVVEMYRDFTEDNSIKADDLRARHGIFRRRPDGSRYEVAPPGGFNPRNRFNINPGIVHLSHRANSLSGEVNLAGVSGILRKKADQSILAGTDPEELLCCCWGGNPNRNSDPLIAQQAYDQVKNGFRYTLANPVGLYIAGALHDRLQTSDGQSVSRDWWKVVRGADLWDPSKSRVLRLEFAPPEGSSLTLEDLTVDGIPVRYAAQLADLLSVHLFVTVWKRPEGSENPSVPCVGTCCRKQGTEQLMVTDQPCDSGYDLAFPGLLKDPEKAAIDTAAAHAPSAPSPVATIAKAASRRI